MRGKCDALPRQAAAAAVAAPVAIMLDAAIAGLIAAVQWPAVGYLFLGIALGIYFGAVPGLCGLIGMAILLPFTFGMEPVSAFAFLLGCTPSPGQRQHHGDPDRRPAGAVAQATVLDGYPMAKQGEAGRAFGAAFTCSAIGGVIGGLFWACRFRSCSPWCCRSPSRNSSCWACSASPWSARSAAVRC